MMGAACYSGAFVISVILSTAAAVDFVRGPGSVVVLNGGTARLKCAVDLNTARGSITLYWYKTSSNGNQYITGGTVVYDRIRGWERYSLETSSKNRIYSYNLKITEVEPGDAGQYQCTALDRGVTTRSQLGSLSVVQEATDEPLTCSFYPESPTVGQTVTFSCTAPRGISPEMLSWWTDGAVQALQPSAHLTNNHGISFVKTLASTDNFATFTCLVGTSFDTENNMNCSVTPLAVPIRAEVTPAVALAVVAGSATFRCQGTAIPPVTRYRWMYGSGQKTVKFAQSKGRFSVVNNGDSSTLTIRGLTMEDNNKMVRCVVLNEQLKNIGSAELQVTTHIETTQRTPSRMWLSDLPTETKVTERTRTTSRTTNKASGVTQEETGTTTGNGTVSGILGCRKDCREKISPQQNSDGGDGSSSGAVAAVLSILAILALATAVIVYLVYVKRGRSTGRVIKRKQKNKPLQRLRSLRLSVSNSNQELVDPDSVRFKTIEVIVNPPPPEWHLRVKDVVSTEQEQEEAQDSPQTTDNTYGPPPSPVKEQSETSALDNGAIYAKADKTKKRKHQRNSQGGNREADDAQPQGDTAPPAVSRHHLAVDAPDDCFSDGLSDASTWDMSSVDSGCEEETEEMRDDAVAYAELDLGTEGKKGKAYTSKTETVEYANTVVTKTSLPRN